MPPVDITERSFKFAVRVVKLCKFLEEEGNVSRQLANQLLRSATSIGANIEEAQAAISKADFTNKMYIACKEARETKYWLCLLKATEIVTESRISSLLEESKEMVAILTTITKNSRVNK